MKRLIHGVLAAMLIVSPVAAKTYTDKTFLMPRSHGMNLAMEYTTWHGQTSIIDKDKFGGSFQATIFYDESENRKDLGKYFGVCNWENGNCIEDFIEVHPGHGAVPKSVHVIADQIFHTEGISGSELTLADRICWRPSRESYGITLDYHQKLDKVLKGLFFKVKLPIVHVKTSLGWSSSCSKACCTDSCNTGCNTGCATACDTKCTSSCVGQKLKKYTGDVPSLTGTEHSLADYLSGCVSTTEQRALCKSKIHNGQSETGIADIDLILGYNFLYKKTRHVNVSIGLTIPLGNTPDGEYLWEPIVGNGNHWALGFGMDSKFQVWKDDDWSLDFICAFNYRYLFASSERRTLGFSLPVNAGFGAPFDGARVRYGHWLLGAQKGDTFKTPMANFLTQDIQVTPGSHFDGVVQLALNFDKWSLDVGYNLFARAADVVRLKVNPCCDSSGCGSNGTCSVSGSGCAPCGSTSTDCTTPCRWADDTFAVAAPGWDPKVAFAPTLDAHIYGNAPINTRDLCLTSVTQPSVVTHKLYGGFGYVFDEMDYPVHLGLGGSYEFDTDNDCLEVWSVWFKAGVTF